MEEGDKVLIHAGASGVGTAAVQLAKLANAVPIVTAGSDKKIEYCKVSRDGSIVSCLFFAPHSHHLDYSLQSMGAAHGVNYKAAPFAEGVLSYADKGVNLILDPVGASHYPENIKAVALEGRWVLYGFLGGHALENYSMAPILRKRLTLTGRVG